MTESATETRRAGAVAEEPPPGSCIRVERPERGLARLVLDPPHRELAVLDMPLVRDLRAALDELSGDADLAGLVVTGRTPTSFAAGADIHAIRELVEPSEVRELVHFGQETFQRIARLRNRAGRPVTTVAAVGGPVPGGAYELALACDRIVLARHPKSRVGLPEVRLGILPGWGGSQRLPRRLGVPAALDAILTGRLFDAERAYRRGLVDRLAWPTDLLRVADEIAAGRGSCERRGRGWAGVLLVDRNPLAGELIRRKTRRDVEKRTGGHYPAPLEALELASRAPLTRLADGLAGEAEAVARLATGSVCKALIDVFLASEDAKRLGETEDGERVESVARGAVIGSGVMGGAIASLMARKGVSTRLRDLDRAALDAAVVDHQAEVAKRRRRRRLTRSEADRALDLLEATTEPVGFARCELVLEAVAERLDVKRAVLGELAGVVPGDAILATNTSSLSVGAIAESIPRPERVVGIHFFNPVARMPLVEIVRAERTDEPTVRRAARFALDLGKTPVVVRDVAGFLVNRILGPYLDEALRLLPLGVNPTWVDQEARRFGLPMGPFELLDEVGLDIATHAAESLHEAHGERMTPSDALGALVEDGARGKKAGRGIYLWERDSGGKPKRGEVNPKLAGTLPGAPARHVGPTEIVDRLVLSMVNEAARCLEERVVATARELDLAAVLGMGFPPFHGGIARYADARGLAAIVERLTELSELPDVDARPGGREKLTPAELLRERAAAGGGMAED